MTRESLHLIHLPNGGGGVSYIPLVFLSRVHISTESPDWLCKHESGNTQNCSLQSRDSIWYRLVVLSETNSILRSTWKKRYSPTSVLSKTRVPLVLFPLVIVLKLFVLRQLDRCSFQSNRDILWLLVYVTRERMVGFLNRTATDHKSSVREWKISCFLGFLLLYGLHP